MSCTLLITCGKNEESPIIKLIPSVPAIAPASNDTTIQVHGLRNWYFHNLPVTHEYSFLEVHLIKERTSRDVDIWIGSAYMGRHSWCNDSITAEIILPDDLASGVHNLIVSETGMDTGFFVSHFLLSEPFCVAVSNDWDSPSDGAIFDSNLTMGSRLHQLHTSLKITHFAGPYAFTDSTIPVVRKHWLSNWLKNRRDNDLDEIGLHIHPYCCFINLASVECKTDSGYRSYTDPTGCRIALDRYTEDETFRMLKCADSVFLAWGLGKPVSFRAGGWTAALHTLKAMEHAGYRVDASACNLSRGDELTRYHLWEFIARNWFFIGDTSQPYYPSVLNLNSDQKPLLSILEVPDNGLLADYIDSTEMIEVFHKNWPGGFLQHPKHLSIGYHPETVNQYFNRLDGALNHIDRFLAVNDSGPVFYVKMSDLPGIWR
jgi:hypothetical protein